MPMLAFWVPAKTLRDLQEIGPWPFHFFVTKVRLAKLAKPTYYAEIKLSSLRESNW